MIKYISPIDITNAFVRLPLFNPDWRWRSDRSIDLSIDRWIGKLVCYFVNRLLDWL